ncbi:MAG TPA: hypothetical protein VF339_02835 [Gammaproteobacteria bacterium]
MSDTKASCKPHPGPRSMDDEPTDGPESLTDLIDVLQRQSFTRRFEPQGPSRIIESEIRSVGATHTSSCEDPSG